MTTLWLCGFIFESSTLMYTFYTSTLNPMVGAGLFDIILTITCLSIFLVAETQRCCDCEGIFNRRILATDYAATDSNKTCEIMCCPAFGTRLCGGIGTLEPFTSLIVLRLFRFFVGKWLSRSVLNLMKYFNRIQSSSDEEKEIESQSEEMTEKEKDESSEKLANIFEHKEGTIADLWAASLLKFPDLVEKHGPFSGLLLEAMLGIQPAPSHTRDQSASQSEVSAKPFLPAETKQSSYSRSVSIGSVKSAIDSIEENERTFDRPASNLIRTMRRCQCQWLPLLDSWEDVDVVLTKYELAWFATTSADSSWDDEANEKDAISRRLLKKSGGGKGLRLCDVVSGRELLGRIQLHDIESVKVMRYPTESKEASQRKVLLENDEEFGKEPSGLVSEYWQEGKQSTEYENVEERWSGVTEDVLTIRTPQGTLCLRFLVDLLSAEEMLSIAPRENTPSKKKRKEEGALLWCKTILYIQSKEKGFHIEGDQGCDGTDFSDVIEVVGDTKKQRRWFQNTLKNRGVESIRIKDNEK
jgi:hypothetical protein